MADVSIKVCLRCGQTFLTDSSDAWRCPSGCRLEAAWECYDCHRFFTKQVEPHTQHEPECPTTPDEDAEIDTCLELGCTFEDVCDDCCNVCNPKPTQTERLEL